jgi:hypothetical protein
MIAYNKLWLDNVQLQQEAEREFDESCISKEENEAIKKNYPVGFYMPNPFVRIGLFVLTVIIAAFTLGLFSLLFLSGGFESFGALSVVFGIITYAALELMVNKNHCKSGVDDALLWMTAAFIVGGINASANVPPLANAWIILLVALLLSLRFINVLMSAVACVALAAVIFYSYIRFGDIAKATTPFLIMIVCSRIYLLSKKLLRMEQWRHYNNCITVVSITALVCFYIAGNYFIVRESSIALFNLHLQDGQSIPSGWLFWIFTILIPPVYILRGIQKKDAGLLRTGLLLVAGMIFTVRYYYHIASIETAMAVGGIVMIAIAYVLIKYLYEPKYGFTYREQEDKLFIDKLQIENLVIAESFTGPSVQPAAGNTEFGGGSGGGGGASGGY